MELLVSIFSKTASLRERTCALEVRIICGAAATNVELPAANHDIVEDLKPVTSRQELSYT